MQYPYNDMYYNAPYEQPSNGLTIREKIQYSLLGIILIGGAAIVGSKIVKKAEAKGEQRKTLEDGSLPTYAKQIKMAFQNDGWPGTDKDALRAAMRSVRSKSDFMKVMSSYQRLYNSSLLGDMQKALKSTEYNEMLAIVSAKPDNNDGDSLQTNTIQLQQWAKRLKAAFDITYGPFPGTDEAAIKAVFLDIPTQDAFKKVGTVYKAMYGNDLATDLKSELELWEYSPMMQLIYSKPKM